MLATSNKIAAIIDKSRRLIWSILGPGWLVMLADVDAPSILTAMQSGYSLGYLMVPWLILLTIPLYLVQELTIRLAIGSGKGLGEVIKDVYGKWIALASLVLMMAIDGAAYIGEYASIAAVGRLFGIPVAVSILAVLVFHTVVIMLGGSYKRVENILLATSAFILVYLAAFIIIGINPHALYQSLTRIINPRLYGDEDYVLLLSANVGAVIMPWMLYYQGSAIVDKGLKPQHYTHERFETAVGSVVSEALMVAGVVVGFALRINNGDLYGFQSALMSIKMIMGAAWLYVASVGMVAAALLAIFVISMGFSYGLSEYLGSKAGFRYRLRDAKLFYAFFAVEVIPAALIVLVTPNLAQVILDVMVFNSIALAMPLVLLIDLTRRRDVVGRYAIGGLRAVVLYILTALILGLGAYAIIGAL
jgi:Mn2+/Fe2+ NRAMP family transporter